MTLYVVLGIVVLVVLYIIFAFNSLIRRRNQAEEAWSDIEVQLKRRYDLIPNVLETVKGYAAHEKGIMENVTAARAAALGATGSEEKARAENALTSTLKTLFAVAENYPDLKANANFLDLQRELADTENKIQASRRFYNGVVRDLNTALESFPTNIIASVFRFVKKEFFDLEDSHPAQEPVKVTF